MKLISAFAAVLIFGLAALPVLAQQPGDPTSSFGDAVLDAPPKDDTGPIEKKPVAFGAEATDQQTAGATSEQPPEPVTGSRVKSYVDGLMDGLITAGELPGASIVIIQDGKIALKAGYGFADIRARIPVDPDQTRFRVASISKLITATAFMQVVEQGKADLNADVNTYLTAFKIAANYPEPVTLANLLTHTAGFDDRYLGLAAPLSAPAEVLAQHLAHAMPPRVLPPNRVIAYSNYGFALAGHIVENVSGQEFNAYVSEHVFAPLAMNSSSFGVPYPMPQSMAVPYFKGGDEGGYRRSELDSPRVGPAGDLITTSTDMAQFMLAHLNNGIYGDGEHLISDLSVEKMHADHFANADGLDGWALGFATGHRNGVRWIGHDGSWRGFCAQLVLQPETKSGFFVVYNVDCHFAASASLRKALFDLLWPSNTQVVASPVSDADARARASEGTYMSVRRARSDFTVMAAGVGQISVKSAGNGELRVFLPGVGHDLSFLPQANGTWKNPDLQWKASYKPEGYGEGPTFMIDANAYDRVVSTGAWSAWTIALAMVAAICIMTIWGWANGFLSRHFFGEPQAVIPFAPRVTGFLAAGLTLASLVSMIALLSDGSPLAVLHGPAPMLYVLLSVPVVIGVLAIPMIVWSVSGFGAGPRARMAQMGYIVLTLTVLAFLAFAWQWSVHPLGLLTN
ncbi:MAG: serine hydrolase domain-containing protein [Micropepsaceae bacterium]